MLGNSRFKNIMENVTESAEIFIKNSTNLPEKDFCTNGSVPDFRTYTMAMDVSGRILFTYGAGALIIIICIYVDTLKFVMKHSMSRTKTPTAIIISIYPVVALVTFCALLVPRAYILAETSAQVMFMCAVYQMFRLFLAYCGGESEMIRRVNPHMLNPQAPPCCCWPCCSVLPKISVNNKTLFMMRVLIIQLPVVQGILYLIFLVAWADKQRPYQVNLAYIQPVILITIFTGIWAMRMTTNVLRGVLEGYCLTGKFLALQLVPLSSQFLGLLTRILVSSNALPCYSPLNPDVFASLIYNCVMLIEIIALACWARSLYKRILPDLEFEIPIESGDVRPDPPEYTVVNTDPQKPTYIPIHSIA